MRRLTHAWRALAPEQRLGALTSLGLFASMFLPWYSKAVTLVVHGLPKATETSLSAFQAFSFVEAAVLLVSAAVLSMLFARAEGRVFQLPGGDGLVVMIAGGWTALLIFYRLLDKPGLQGNERLTATVGVEWGIFMALLLALGLTYAGARIRTLERPPAPLRRPRGATASAGAELAAPWEPSPPREPRPRPASAPRVVSARAPGEQGAHAPGQQGAHAPGEQGAGEPGAGERAADKDLDATVVTPARERASARPRRSPPVPARAPGGRAGGRARYPPPPPPASSPEGEQLSFEDPPTRSD